VLASRQAVESAEARVDQSETSIARAELALADAERRLAETRITAGFSGTLRDVTVIEGRLVTANEQLATLVDGTSLEVAFRVSTAQFSRLLADDGALIDAPVSVTLDSGDSRIEASGRITRQSAAVAEGESGRVLYATLDDAPAMKPGDFVSVAVEEPPLDRVTRLPATALGTDGAVLVLDEGDRLERLEVTLLRRQGNDILARAETLPGREVVAERTPVLGPGIKVRRVGQEATAEQAANGETLSLSPNRRARLKAYVTRNDALAEAERERILSDLDREQVPARTVERLERRMGG
jgi:RND family efflux transporter MFP subunit